MNKMQYCVMDSIAPPCVLLKYMLLCLFASGGSVLAADTTKTPMVKPALVGQRVLWLGDSNTQDGRYVSAVAYYLNKRFPDQRVDIISIGLASETASGLSEHDHPFLRPNVHERLQRALDAVKPAVVVACYGMNDGIYHPQSPERMNAFQNGMMSLIATVKAARARLILLTPPPFDALQVKSTRSLDAADFSYRAPYQDYDTVLAEYSAWQQTLNALDVLVVDIHTPLLNYIKNRRLENPTFSFSGDGIHPDAAGHLLMAYSILKALDIAVEVTELEAGVKSITADPLYQLVARQRQLRSEGWLPYVGYTRGQTVKTDSIEATEQAATRLQEQIDEHRKLIGR